MANTKLVPTGYCTSTRENIGIFAITGKFKTRQQTRPDTSSIQEVKATGNVFQPEQLRYDNTTNTILNSSLRQSTRSKYLPYQRKW